MDMHDSDVLDLPIQGAVWLWFCCWKTLDKYYYNKIIILHTRLWHVRKVIKIDTVTEQKKSRVKLCTEKKIYTYDIGCHVLLDKCKKIL